MLDVVVSELSLNMPNTYVETNTTCGALIARHLDDTLRWNIAIPSEWQQLPSLYWLPKLHKNPYGARFIAACNTCTTKPLSRLLTFPYNDTIGNIVREYLGTL